MSDIKELKILDFQEAKEDAPSELVQDGFTVFWVHFRFRGEGAKAAISISDEMLVDNDMAIISSTIRRSCYEWAKENWPPEKR